MALEVQIFGRDIELNEKFEEYVNRKTAKLDRYLNGIREARVDLRHVKTAREATERYVAQITVQGKGYTLRTEERTNDIRSAFDAALEKMQSRVARYKGKRFSVRGDASSLADAALEAMQAEYAPEEAEGILRRKKFLLHPMDEDEALEQMRLLDHEDFFIFYNVDTNAVSVLYHRRDGSYGLIDTELA